MSLKLKPLAFWGVWAITLLSCRSQLRPAEPPACALPLLSCPDTSACVDVLNDPANCGACQSRCPADATCVQGACQPLCPSGFVSCGPDGGAAACADLQRDPRHCGGCGRACASWEICSEGQCALTCSDGQNLCTGDNGRFCTDLRTDNRNCGDCGHACSAGKACRQGSCDDCRMTLAFAERDWFWPLAPLRSRYVTAGPTVSGDFNGDGKLDLVVDLAFGQMRILFGDGTGQLALGDLTTLKGVARTIAMETFDFNRDGKLDIVAMIWDTSLKLMILLGKGDGHFDPQTPFPLPFSVVSMTLADVNGDGIPDLVTAGNGVGTSSYAGVVVVLIAADGSMRVSDQQTVGGVLLPPVVADLTGDGIPDLALAQTRQLRIMRGKGKGQFEPGALAFEGWDNLSAAAGDLDGDGKAELIAMGWLRTDAGETTARLGIVNGATGQVRETLTEIYPSRADLFVRDVDADGKLDLIASPSSSMVKDVWVLAGKGDGSLTPGPKQELGASTLSLGDFNGDGRPDLVMNETPLTVCLGGKGGVFAPPANRVSKYLGALDAVDVDGDGHADLIATHPESLSILRGKGDGSFHAALSVPTKLLGNRPAVADFDADGRTDVCCSKDRGLLKGQPDGSFLNLAALPSSGCRMLNPMVRDLDRDGILDLISPEEKNVCVMRGKTSLSLAERQDYPALFNLAAGAVAVGDLDGDRNQDVVAALSDRSAVAILYGKADGSFESSVQYEVGPNPVTVAISDWNGDGRPDLVVADDAGLSTFQNRGQRTWAPRFLVSGTVRSKRVLSVDWNGDGFDDLLSIDVTSLRPVIALLSRGDGRFESATLDASMGASDAAIADFDHDGRPDIAIGEFDRPFVRVFLQKGVSCAR